LVYQQENPTNPPITIAILFFDAQNSPHSPDEYFSTSITSPQVAGRLSLQKLTRRLGNQTIEGYLTKWDTSGNQFTPNHWTNEEETFAAPAPKGFVILDFNAPEDRFKGASRDFDLFLDGLRPR